MFLKENLFWLRKAKGFTTTVTAAGCGIARSTYMNYENGVHEPKASEIIDICQFFGISIDDLLQTDLQNAYLNGFFTLPEITKNASVNASAKASLKRKKEGNTQEDEQRKEQTDLLILRQLNYIADQVSKIDKKLDRKGD